MQPPPAFRGPFRIDPRARSAYAEGAGIYRIIPAAIARPADADDLRGLVRWAAASRIPLIPRGAGSAMGGGNVGEGVVVDLTGMAPLVLEIEPTTRRARASAWVTLAELNAAAGPFGLRLPPDPASGPWATLGGVVATNAAGPRSYRYGSVREWVAALSIITADGDRARLARGGPRPDGVAALDRFHSEAEPVLLQPETMRLVAERFPRTRKNSSGYALDAWLRSGDPIDLLIGSEGTLALVTETEWRLDPIPAARAGMRVALRSLDDLGAAVAALAPGIPSAVELLDRTFLDLVGTDRAGWHGAAPFADAEALLLLEFEGEDAAEIEHRMRGAAEAVAPFAIVVDAAHSPAEEERLWALRHAASPILASLPETRRSLQVIEDGCVPVPRLGEYIAAIRRAAAARDLSVVIFGHAGDGHVHVNVLPELAREGWEAGIASLLEEITSVVVGLGGTPSGEHGDGRLRAGLVERVYGAELVARFRLLKRAFDPAGILNPGVILPNPALPMDAIDHLKAGATAIQLPDDIARALRQVERGGGYGRSRLEIADGGLGARS